MIPCDDINDRSGSNIGPGNGLMPDIGIGMLYHFACLYKNTLWIVQACNWNTDICVIYFIDIRDCIWKNKQTSSLLSLIWPSIGSNMQHPSAEIKIKIMCWTRNLPIQTASACHQVIVSLIVVPSGRLTLNRRVTLYLPKQFYLFPSHKGIVSLASKLNFNVSWKGKCPQLKGKLFISPCIF